MQLPYNKMGEQVTIDAMYGTIGYRFYDGELRKVIAGGKA